MRTTPNVLSSFVWILVLATVGCGDAQHVPTAAIDVSDNEEFGDGAAISYRFFTGRDSFGVAMKIRADGTVETSTDGRCGSDLTLTLEGTGSATHLGRIEGVVTHCAPPGDLASFYDGEFLFTGAAGGTLSGSYAPDPAIEVLTKGRPRDGIVIETKAEIDGGDIDAVQRDETEGRGDLLIVLRSDDRFDLTFDGWLLHHLAVD